MEYVNFYVSLPILAYLSLEDSSKKLNLTRNELVNKAVAMYLSNSKHLSPKNNARFSNLYN